MRERLWPFGQRAAILMTPVLLVALLLFVAAMRRLNGWPATSDTAILTAVLVLSLVPLGLATADLLVDRGAVLEYGGIKIDLSYVRGAADSIAITVPSNIGAPNIAVGDSGSTQILDALERTAGHEVLVVDLEAGNAWWQTRLLVLLSGAARRGRPSAIVFVATTNNQQGTFLGWAPPAALRDRLLASSRLYQECYDTAQAVDKQWGFLDPTTSKAPGTPIFLTQPAQRHLWMAFENGRSKPWRFEQVLAAELGEKVEAVDVPRGISAVQLDELFLPVLNRTAIDEANEMENQLNTLFATHEEFVAVTRAQTYQRLLPRALAVNVVLKDLVLKSVGRSK